MITLYAFGPAFRPARPESVRDQGRDAAEDGGLPYRTTPPASAGRRRASSPISTTTASALEIRPSSASTSKRNTVSISIAASTARSARAAWAFEKLAETISIGCYFTALDRRRQFREGSAPFLRQGPAPVRPLVVAMIRRQVRKNPACAGHRPSHARRNHSARDAHHRLHRRLPRAKAVLHGD